MAALIKPMGFFSVKEKDTIPLPLPAHYDSSGMTKIKSCLCFVYVNCL